MTRRLQADDFTVWPQAVPNEDCVRCPHCDVILEVSDNRWSDDRGSYDDGVMECPACGQEFMLTVQYVMHVSARSID